MPIYNEFGYITIDDARIDETCNAYFKWKDLNTYISNNSHRGINMPDAISEPMGCYCLGLLWNRGDEVGDATDPNTGKKIEFKATSRFEGDLSSFGPKCVSWMKIYCIYMTCILIQINLVSIRQIKHRLFKIKKIKEDVHMSVCNHYL